MGKPKKHTNPEKDWDFKRKWDGSHITRCKKGYLKKGYRQVHHIVCYSAVQDSYILVGKEHIPFIHECMKVTVWDVNDPNNCLGMPLKLAYYDRPRDTTKWDIACHQVDHNPHYTEDVVSFVNSNVWSKLLKQEEDCSVEKETIAQMLDDCITHYKDFLTARGAGTKNAWEKRHEKAWENKWYIPFSMHPGTPPKRAPPPERKDLPKNISKMVSDFFKHAK